jgi:hypothetical protein
VTPQACLNEARYDLKVFLPSQGMASKLNESQSAPRLDFQVTQNELRKEAAQSKTRELAMSNVL